MPLYKRKVFSRKNCNTLHLNCKDIHKENRTFKTPLIQNEIRLNDLDSDKHEISKEQKHKTKKTLTNQQFQQPNPPEFQINCTQIENRKHISTDGNMQKRVKHYNADVKKSKIPDEEMYYKSKHDQTSKRKERIISNIFRNEKGDTINSKEKKAFQVAVEKDKNDVNNNKQIKKKRTTKTKSKQDEANSSRDDSVVSLWLQSRMTPSQEPPEHLTYMERLLWLQDKRNVGLYAQCDKCNKFRYLKDTADPLDLPDLWYCHMNPDKNYNKCSTPEYVIPIWEEDDLIYNLYNAGSVVWAKLDGYPWWPAMVDDDPNTEMYYWLNGFSDIPTHYHVVFFDSEEVTRAWLKPGDIKKFKDNIDNPHFDVPKRQKHYKFRIDAAKKQANDALNLQLADRLKNYSFLARWTKAINPPKDLTEAVQTKKRKLKRVKASGTKKDGKKSKVDPNISKFKLSNFTKEAESGYSGNSSFSSTEIFGDNDVPLNVIDYNLIDF